MNQFSKDQTIKNVKFQRHGNPTWRVYNSYKFVEYLCHLITNGSADYFEIFAIYITYICVIVMQVSQLTHWKSA